MFRECTTFYDLKQNSNELIIEWYVHKKKQPLIAVSIKSKISLLWA